MVEVSWSAPVYGNPDFVFPFKLKRLKVAMKVWNQQVFGNVNARLSQAQLRFEVASRNSDEDPFDTFKQNEMKDALALVNDARMQQHIMLKQKSRNKWILEGSSNSSYFHSSIKTRRSSNTISELVNEEGCIINEPDQLRDHVVSYYENKFNGVDEPIKDSLFGYEHNSISHEERLMLDSIPSLDEIKGAVFDLNADSAPGPDATRLVKVLDKLVSEEQVAFMKGRNIHENISLASELVNELHIKRKDGNLGLKLDISQTFDTGNQKSLTNSLRLLEVYQQASGQRVCREKSKIYFGGGSLHRRQAIANFLGMGVTFFPDRYLGVKVMPGRVKYSHISNVVDKLKDHLSVYKGKMLSFQDRVVLIKSVLASYDIYNMVVYRWPVKFVKQSERVIRNFLWSGDSDLAKSFVVGYDKICSPVKEGGLGLTSLSNMNKALIMKLWWSIKTSKKNWARFMESKYTCRDGRLKMAGVKSSILPGIRWVHTEVMRNTKSLIGDGRETSLFFDVWYGSVTLAEVLQRTDLDRRARVSDIIVQNQWHLEGEHMRDLASAGVARANLPIRLMGSDERIWMPDLKGMFSVRSARDLVRSKYPLLLEANMLWRRVVHPALAAQNWKFVRRACATLDKVKSRFKIALPSRCSVCQIEEESLEHILWRCSAAKRAWQWLEGIFHLKSCYNLIASNKQTKGCSRMVKDLWLLSNLVVRSELWFQRNKMVYEKKKPCWNFFKKRVFNFIHEYSDRMKGCMLNRVEDLEILDFFRVKCRKVKILEPVECLWQPPMQNQLLLFCDGASRGNPGAAGAGVVARNSACEVVGAMCVVLGVISNSLAELYSILIGLDWAVQWGYRDVLLRTDSMSVITALEGDNIPWFARQRWYEAKVKFDSIQLVHTFREANFAADKMAKTGCFLDSGILATKLDSVLDNLVSEEQVVFMKGRNIHENISVASEMGNMKSLHNLLDLLGKYQTASGQNVCRQKSKVYYGGGSLSRCRPITNLLGMKVSTFPDRKGKLLSFQDRIVLINSVIDSYAIHNMAVYKWPKKFIQQDERVIRNFLWSGDAEVARKFVVGFPKVCLLLKEGGLGITSMAVTNKALLMKLWWSIRSSSKKWARFLWAKYTSRLGRIKQYGVNSSILPGIRLIHTTVDRNTKVLLGDGRNTSLYFDVWYGNECIVDI
ncbi:uncharacterized protein LOC113272826 [Papaver somniferum]|uniref:uncharacterized protein LOC113272826 n=1 Tax=Papaver somniferum TaxID=3469 RepID=UPI000E6FEBA3|nr:uncharacterized protein LOC113272826 [Papaver somniferum]